MRRSETLNISEIIEALIRKQGLGPKLAENRLVNSWPELVGKTVAMRTRRIYISKRILYVHLESSIVRNELMLVSDELLRRLNETAGMNVIDKIVFR
jgi:predicted nucleic acid-binding Zn ribbon protein